MYQIHKLEVNPSFNINFGFLNSTSVCKTIRIDRKVQNSSVSNAQERHSATVITEPYKENQCIDDFEDMDIICPHCQTGDWAQKKQVRAKFENRILMLKTKFFRPLQVYSKKALVIQYFMVKHQISEINTIY